MTYTAKACTRCRRAVVVAVTSRALDVMRPADLDAGVQRAADGHEGCTRRERAA